MNDLARVAVELNADHRQFTHVRVDGREIACLAISVVAFDGTRNLPPRLVLEVPLEFVDLTVVRVTAVEDRPSSTIPMGR